VHKYLEISALRRNHPRRQKNRRIEIILEPYVEQKLAKELLDAKTFAKVEKKK
jgi:hypothetical protein